MNDYVCVHIGVSITPFCPIGQNDVMETPRSEVVTAAQVIGVSQ